MSLGPGDELELLAAIGAELAAPPLDGDLAAFAVGWLRAALGDEPLARLGLVSEPGRLVTLAAGVAADVPGGRLIAAVARVTAAAHERQRVAAAVAASECRFRELVELLPLSVFEVDRGGRIVYMNPHGRAMWGIPDEEGTPGSSVLDISTAPNRARVAAELGRVLRGEVVRGLEFASQRPGGPLVMTEVDAVPVWRDGEVVGARGVALEVTARRAAEEALRHSERRFRELAALLPQLVWETDAVGRFTFMNRAGLALLGYTEADVAAGLSWTQIVDPADVATTAAGFAASSAGPERAGFELGAVARDGRRMRHVVYAAPELRDGRLVGIRGVSIDVTAQRRAEEERRELDAKVQHAQKLESLGVLAGGIAHDFNNLLVGILGNAELALTEVRPEAAPAGRLHRIKVAAERGADLTNQMLAYAGKGRSRVHVVDLSAIVEEMGHLVRSGVTRHGVLHYELDRGLPRIAADATQLRQVAMNLVINASDALNAQPGVITVSTGAVEVDPATLQDAWCADDMTPGRYVFLQVEDSGCGMDAATRARVFDPFFTTKFTGRGLGLAAVLGIVRAHRGAIEVRSEPGRGSTFRVLLPVPALDLAVAAEEVPRRDGWRGRGTVLVVDDEEEVCDVTAAVLRRAGFEVLCAVDGRDGLRLLREHATAIVVVLLDLTMPQLSGEATLRELRRDHPQLPVVMVSGYSEPEVLRRLAGLRVAGTLQKPFTLAGLLAKVRLALGAAGDDGGD